jgi:hypothetical protein
MNQEEAKRKASKVIREKLPLRRVRRTDSK